MARFVLPWAALLVLQGSSGSRPAIWLDESRLSLDGDEGKDADGARFYAAWRSQNTTLSGVVSSATGLPTWTLRAATWPVTQHPAVGLSLAALDLATSFVDLGNATRSWWRETPPFAASSLVETGIITYDILVWDVLFVAICLVLIGIPAGWLATCCFAGRHKLHVTDQRPAFPSTEQLDDSVSMRRQPHAFHNGIFACCCSANVCLYACLCPYARHADTLATARVSGYWAVFALFLASDVLAASAAWVGSELLHVNPVQTFDLWRAVLFALVFFPDRQRLRAKLGAPPGRCCADCFAWLCCSLCSIGQEGMQVDKVQGVDVQCPCTLLDKKTGEIVGAAVEAGKS